MDSHRGQFKVEEEEENEFDEDEVWPINDYPQPKWPININTPLPFKYKQILDKWSIIDSWGQS